LINGAGATPDVGIVSQQGKGTFTAVPAASIDAIVPQTKDKANNAVVLDKPTYDRIIKEVPTFKMITQFVACWLRNRIEPSAQVHPHRPDED
jgi:hypothetical protein